MITKYYFQYNVASKAQAFLSMGYGFKKVEVIIKLKLS